MRTPKRQNNHYRPSGSILAALESASWSEGNGDEPPSSLTKTVKRPRIGKTKPAAKVAKTAANRPQSAEAATIPTAADSRASEDVNSRSSRDDCSRQAIKAMNTACAHALSVSGDIQLVAKELFMFIGVAMNGLGHTPSALGDYLISEGRALRHPKALEEGEHLSAIAYISQARGISPVLDELQDLRQQSLYRSSERHRRRGSVSRKR